MWCARGYFYSIDMPSMRVKQHDGPQVITNGPTFSLDWKTIYHNDTTKGLMNAYDIQPDGSLANKRVAYHHAFWMGGEGMPDGMCTDEEGCIWVAAFGGSKILRFDPNARKVIQVVHVPEFSVTSCCFGGENLDYLYITTAKFMNKLNCSAGNLYRIKLEIRGLSLPKVPI